MIFYHFDKTDIESETYNVTGFNPCYINDETKFYISVEFYFLHRTLHLSYERRKNAVRKKT